MIDEQTLREVTERLIAVAQPSRIILFGSYARGDADEDSDVDLMIIKSEVADKFEEMVRLRATIGSIGTGVDVLVYSESEIEEKKDRCTTPVYWALREGRVLYASG